MNALQQHLCAGPFSSKWGEDYVSPEMNIINNSMIWAFAPWSGSSNWKKQLCSSVSLGHSSTSIKPLLEQITADHWQGQANPTSLMPVTRIRDVTAKKWSVYQSEEQSEACLHFCSNPTISQSCTAKASAQFLLDSSWSQGMTADTDMS